MKKYIYTLFATFSIFLFSINADAQSKKIETISIKVEGICGMCKERIENALSVKGIKKASWDLETRMCEITYRKDKLTEKDIHKLLNAVGHDTEKSTASKEEYDKVHHCCKYRDMDTH